MTLDIKLSHEYTPRVKARITVMTIVTICLVAALAVIAIRLGREVQEHETLGFDRQILFAIHSHATPFFNELFVRTTDIGSPIFSSIIGLAIGLYLAYKKRIKSFLIMGGSMIGAAGTAYIIKSIVERPRPHLWHHQLVHETGFSFISGHATMSMALAAAAIAIVWHTKWRWPAIIVGGLYVLYIGFSRLYLGVHYPTDVIGGWIVAFAWVLVLVLVLRLLLEDSPYKIRK